MALTEVTVWRGVLKEDYKGNLYTGGDPAPGLLVCTFEATTFYDRDNFLQTRAADNLATQLGTETELHVSAKKGTSVWNRVGRFGFAKWRYFEIEKGTELPEPLVLRYTHSIDLPLPNDATRTPVKWDHYQIEPKSRMSKAAYIGALETMARSAVARLVERAHA